MPKRRRSFLCNFHIDMGVTMITHQILQKTIDGINSITKVDFVICDPEGIALATTVSDVTAFAKPASEFASSPAESQVIGEQQYFGDV